MHIERVRKMLGLVGIPELERAVVRSLVMNAESSRPAGAAIAVVS
ncbi:MAG TPA: hypothetical protein VID93_03880 [Acidimicrobiales bacterium]